MYPHLKDVVVHSCYLYPLHHILVKEDNFQVDLKKMDVTLQVKH